MVILLKTSKEKSKLMGKHFTRLEKSWISYDWANSSYATIMLAAIFPVYFTSMVGNGDGDMWIGYGGAIATSISAILAPILGSFGDYKGYKKGLFAVFLVIGVLATAACAFYDSWQMLLVGYILSNIGFNGSLLFADSMLPEITTPERMNRVSAWAYSMGYIGGSTIPFVLSILLITFAGTLGIDTIVATKLSMLACSLWWAVFSLPILLDYKQYQGKKVPESGHVKSAFVSVFKTARDILKNRGLALFIVSYFFYIDGVGTVIKMSTAYGASLNIDSYGMILALLVTQLVAFPFAIIFGKLGTKYNTVNVILFAIGIYLTICLLGFYMGYGIEEGFLSTSNALIIFWILATLVGTAQGGIQALSRSYFGMIIPKERATEYFGFFDIFGRFAAVLGPAIYGLLKSTTGRSSFAILSISVFFALGGAILIYAKKYLPNK